jgi:hypothetical protein
MIYTSYFGNIKNVSNPIAICGKSPEWYTGFEYKKLAPKFWFFDKYKKGEISKFEYTEHYYREVLNLLAPYEIKIELFNLYPNKEDITLLCYEKPELFCHRHIVEKWFMDNAIECKEL